MTRGRLAQRGGARASANGSRIATSWIVASWLAAVAAIGLGGRSQASALDDDSALAAEANVQPHAASVRLAQYAQSDAVLQLNATRAQQGLPPLTGEPATDYPVVAQECNAGIQSSCVAATSLQQWLLNQMSMQGQMPMQQMPMQQMPMQQTPMQQMPMQQMPMQQPMPTQPAPQAGATPEFVPAPTGNPALDAIGQQMQQLLPDIEQQYEAVQQQKAALTQACTAGDAAACQQLQALAEQAQEGIIAGQELKQGVIEGGAAHEAEMESQQEQMQTLQEIGQYSAEEQYWLQQGDTERAEAAAENRQQAEQRLQELQGQ